MSSLNVFKTNKKRKREGEVKEEKIKVVINEYKKIKLKRPKEDLSKGCCIVHQKDCICELYDCPGISISTIIKK